MICCSQTNISCLKIEYYLCDRNKLIICVSMHGSNPDLNDGLVGEARAWIHVAL